MNPGPGLKPSGTNPLNLFFLQFLQLQLRVRAEAISSSPTERLPSKGSVEAMATTKAISSAKICSEVKILFFKFQINRVESLVEMLPELGPWFDSI